MYIYCVYVHTYTLKFLQFFKNHYFILLLKIFSVITTPWLFFFIITFLPLYYFSWLCQYLYPYLLCDRLTWPLVISFTPLNLFSLSHSPFLWLTVLIMQLDCVFPLNKKLFTNIPVSLKDCFCFNCKSKLFEYLRGDSRGREQKKHKQIWTEVSQNVSIIYYCYLFTIEGVLSWALCHAVRKEEGRCCRKVNQEITIKFFCCLVEVFRMCFLYIFIRP